MRKEKKQREIKFRAWDKKEKEMWIVKYLGFTGKGELEQIGLVNDYGNYYKIVDSGFVLMQFTGLKDKNGKEIYEGDVIGEDKEVFGVIIWDKENARFGVKFRDRIDKSRMPITEWFDTWKWRNWGVIGNIYENPKLLKTNLEI